MDESRLKALRTALTRLINADRASLHANSYQRGSTADRKARERDTCRKKPPR
jgi:hypothetical protein